MNEYNFMRPFRFWCQKVLPLVYDDSLSYYEVLCKVVTYLNNMIEDLKKLGSDITELAKLYEQLKKYVDDYFSNPEFAAIVDAKLDEMAEDGTLAEIINQQIFDDLNDKIDAVTATARIAFVGGDKIGCCAFVYNTQSHHATVIDCGSQASAAQLINWLQHCGITTIDAVIISHWHSDHMSGLTSLLGNNVGIGVSGLTLYCPHENLNYSSMIGDFSTIESRQNDAIAAVEARGGTAIFPYEGQEIEAYGGKFAFHNLQASYFADYYDVTELENQAIDDETNYNNFSMVVTFTIGGKTAMFTADIMPAAQENVGYLAANADLITVEHHGLNYITNDKYRNSIRADFIVNQAYGGGYSRAMNVKHPTIDRGLSVGAFYQTLLNNLIFEIGNAQIRVIEGMPLISEQYDNVLGVGKSIYPASDHADDFNNYTVPGIYVIANSEAFERMDNKPSGLSGGGKLLVAAGTELGAITQFYIGSSSTTAPVCIRCMDYDGTWHRWNTSFGGTYRLASLEAEWYVADVTPTATQYACRFDTINSIATIDLRFTANEDIDVDDRILTIPSQFAYARTVYFALFDADGNAYPCRLYPTTDGLRVLAMKQIPDTTEVFGSVTWILNPAYGFIEG